MGTSKGYSMPTGGAWTPLKTDASKFVKGSGGNSSKSTVFGRYVNALKTAGYGGSGSGGSGGTGGGKGGNKGGSAARSAIVTGQRLGGFLSRVSEIGLTETLKELGLADLVGKTAEEVILGLTDFFADPASTLDEEAARVALEQLYQEMFYNTEDIEEMEAAFSEKLNDQGVLKTVADFFGKYLFHKFCRDFYEDWEKKVGHTQANQKLDEVKDYINSSIKAEFAGDNDNNWVGEAGFKASEQILRDTLDIFEVQHEN